MGSLKSLDARPFTLEGQISNFILKHDYWLKYLQIQIDGIDYRIKPSSELRETLPPDLAIGDRVRVSGWGQRKQTGQLKLQADVLEVITPEKAAAPNAQPIPSPVTKSVKPKAKVLVCQKSGCMKRGGSAVCAALEQTLRDRDLADQVTIQGTGCMDRCKAGPNLVFMPDRARYSRVNAHDIAALVDQHLTVADVV